uniref:Uncharacterized protein n=1 Tax=Quercus lobata TaxID=97700 RepID=A0A7N2N1F2_QUELO
MNKLLDFGRKALFYVRVLSGYEERRIRSFRLELEQRMKQAQERKAALRKVPEQAILAEVRRMVEEMQNLNKKLEETWPVSPHEDVNYNNTLWAKCFEGEGNVRNPHLDDTLVMCDADINQMLFLRLILSWFEIILGLKINLDKSDLFLVGVVPNFEMLVGVLGCKQGLLPMKYLDLPLGAKWKDRAVWNPIIEKVERRESKLLSVFWDVIYGVSLRGIGEDKMCWTLAKSKVFEEAAIEQYFKPIDKEAEVIMKMQLDGEEKTLKEMMKTMQQQALLEKAEAEKIANANQVGAKQSEDQASTKTPQQAQTR